jgi:hypothetical protein
VNGEHDGLSDIADAYTTTPSPPSAPAATPKGVPSPSGSTESERPQAHHSREAAVIDAAAPDDIHIGISPLAASFDASPRGAPVPVPSDPSADLITEIEAAIEDSQYHTSASGTAVRLTEAVESPVEGRADPEDMVETVKDGGVEDGAAADDSTEGRAPRESTSSVPESWRSRQPSITIDSSFSTPTGSPAKHGPPKASPRRYQPRRASTRVERVVKQRQDEDLDALLSRNMPLPPVMSYAEVRSMRSTRDRATAYAVKINALSKEESGLQHWVRRTRDKGRKGEAGFRWLCWERRVLTGGTQISWHGYGQELELEL